MFKDTDCQLLSSSRTEVTLQRMPGYTYYDIIPWQVIITFFWSVSCQHENKTIQLTLVTLTFRAFFKKSGGGAGGAGTWKEPYYSEVKK